MKLKTYHATDTYIYCSYTQIFPYAGPFPCLLDVENLLFYYSSLVIIIPCWRDPVI